ncbi:hypothetical protein NQZ79_g8502 [Umbelopsis isabellina]|nr:hypothetical protein NQZ79_g8502 [Umbelopsis isabellina]
MSTAHNRNDLLVVSSHGHIYCLHKKSGFRLWRNDFPAGRTGGLVSLFITDTDQLLASAFGKTCCLDLFTGAHRWTNNMDGMGYHEISLMATPTNNHSITYSPPANEKSGFGGDQSNYNPPPEYASNDVSVVLACSYGKVMGINSHTGQSIWRFDCPGGGFNLPSVLAEKDVIFIGCGRMVYALNPKNGGVYWETKATNGIVGSGWLTMATVWGSRQAEM